MRTAVRADQRFDIALCHQGAYRPLGSIMNEAVRTKEFIEVLQFRPAVAERLYRLAGQTIIFHPCDQVLAHPCAVSAHEFFLQKVIVFSAHMLHGISTIRKR